MNTGGMGSLPPFTPSYELNDAFSTTFEDPFSYPSGPDFSSLLEDTTTNPHNESSNNSADEGSGYWESVNYTGGVFMSLWQHSCLNAVSDLRAHE